MIFRLMFGILLLLTLAACIPHAAHVPPQTILLPAPEKAPQQLRIQADGRIEAIPDQLRLRLGVITEGVQAGPAVTENNHRMQGIMTMLADLGIEKKDLATGQYQIQPQWSQPPRPTPANWQREIIGYRITNDLWIKTQRIDLAGELLALAHKSGANQVGNLQFTVSDQDHYQQQAMTLATQKAVRQARVLAAAAGAELGAVLSLSLDSSGGFFGVQPMMAEVRSSAAPDTVPVTPGNVDIQANVTLVFELITPTRTQ